MKTKTILIGIAVFFYTFFHISVTRAETSPSALILNEIQCTNNKFIELYNPSDQCLSPEETGKYQLKRRYIGTTDGKPTEKTYSIRELPVKAIPSKSFLLWVKNGDSKYSGIADTSSTQTIVIGNSIGLFYNDALVDSVVCGSGTDLFTNTASVLENPTGDKSIIKSIIDSSWDISSNPTPTKSTDTSCPAPEPDPTPDPATPSTNASSLRINEIFPNPSAKDDAGEFIELYNSGTKSADISGWILRDATKTGKYVFPSATIITAGAYLAVTDQSFKLSLNNSGETISLFDNTDVLIDSVHYEKTKEDVSLNYTATGWRGGTPTPGMVNQINNLPETKEKVPKKGYRNVPVAFGATGSDTDGNALKYTWDFGDGHKSYKAETSHTYGESGTYAVTLTITDGVEDTVETFSIEIRRYKPPKIRITAIVPNPEGNDTDNEWILLRNRGKKTVNLKDFSIATGWKNLINHPVREDFLIEAGKEAKLTHEQSLFALPNQKGKVELRAPDGKMLQKIRYKLEKSAAENGVYGKEKGRRWEWRTEQATDDEQTTEPSAFPDTLGADQEDDTPTEEETPPEETTPLIEDDLEAKVPEEKISRADNAEKFARLLSYGTRVEVPDDIALAFDETVDDTVRLSPQEHYAVSFAKESLSRLNASLNGLFADVR